MKNWFLYLLAVVILFVTIKQCKEDYEVKKQIDKIEKQNDSINKAIKLKQHKIDSLDQQLVKQEKSIDSLNQIKQKVKVERQIVFRDIENATETDLDSIIKSQPKKEVVTAILDYPLVKNELKLTEHIADSLKASVNNLKLSNNIKDEIISSKDVIISNITKQRDIYKKASQPKSGLFLYGKVPITNFNSPEIGVLYQFKNTLIIGAGAQYNNLTQAPEVTATIGIKIL